MLDSRSFPRPTPWVSRLIVVNAVVLLLLTTVLTSGQAVAALAFDPGTALTRPWTWVTYLFVHAGVLHLAANMLALYVFGTPVESRLGSRTFLAYYLFCGIGAALVSLGMDALHLFGGEVIGASGAVLGVAVAFAMLWPEAEILVFPIPVPIRARTLVIFYAILSLTMSVIGSQDGVAHPAHLGGLLFGWLWFKLRDRAPRITQVPARRMEPVVMAQTAMRETGPHESTPPRPGPGPRDADPQAAEIDRVLDKISARGISSLTPEERRFLDEVSKRKRDVN
jgi:membrane associated rhomboid family serine protease